jgi:hypothetical protein
MSRVRRRYVIGKAQVCHGWGVDGDIRGEEHAGTSEVRRRCVMGEA